MFRGESNFFNLDLSNNDCFNKNNDKILLLSEFVDQTSLYILDLSHVLYGKEPERFLKMNENYKFEKYKSCIDSFTKKLEKEQKNYIKRISDINYYNMNIKKENDFENKELFEQGILSIINNEQSKYPAFINLEVKKVILEFINEKKINKEDSQKIYKNLIDYINLQLSKKKIYELEKEKNSKKAIII